MKAIRVRFHGPTDTKGSRYSADDGDGNRVMISANPSMNYDGNHDAAAIALCRKMGWTGPLMRGGLGNETVYVFDSPQNRVEFDLEAMEK